MGLGVRRWSNWQRITRRRSIDATKLRCDRVDPLYTHVSARFGRLACVSGMDMGRLKNLFGHNSVDMTTHYLVLDTDGMPHGPERFAWSVGSRPRAA